MASPFVDFVADDEKLLDLAKFLSYLSTQREKENPQFVKEFEPLITANKFPEVVVKLVDEKNCKLLFGLGTEKEIESFFYALVAAVKRSKIEDKVLDSLLTALSSTGEEKHHKASLRIFNHLYNNLSENPATKYKIFLATFKHGMKVKNGEYLTGNFDRVEPLIQDLNLTPDQKKELFKLIMEVVKKGKSSTEGYYWAVKYLSLDVPVGPEDQSLILSVITEGIKSPEIYQFEDLLNVKVVQQMAASQSPSKLFQLLKIFTNENFEQFEKFHAENPNLLKENGLDYELCAKKMRLLSLATLAAAERELTYSAIAKALHLEENQVEHWVILAVAEHIIVGKMDQSKKTVTVHQSLQRVFGKQQWKLLGSYLENWKSNLTLILKTVQDSKEQQGLKVENMSV